MGMTRTRVLVRPRVLAMVVASLLVIGLPTEPTASAAPAWTATASAKQVYVTGLAPSARVSLISPGGQTLATRPATAQGGVLFRDVAPGSGYRVRNTSDGLQSGLLTVHTEQAVPWNPSA
ncbi:MAG: peptidase, partial [Acidimicrobiales bacterium]|nr:peptidase [Acidimicrobiales bacterium]